MSCCYCSWLWYYVDVNDRYRCANVLMRVGKYHCKRFYILCAEITVPSALTKTFHYSSEIRSVMRDMLEKVWGVGTVAIRMDSRAGAIRATENDDKAKVSVRSIKWQTQFECGTVITLFFKQAHLHVKTNRRKMNLRGYYIYIRTSCMLSLMICVLYDRVMRGERRHQIMVQ